MEAAAAPGIIVAKFLDNIISRCGRWGADDEEGRRMFPQSGITTTDGRCACRFMGSGGVGYLIKNDADLCNIVQVNNYLLVNNYLSI